MIMRQREILFSLGFVLKRYESQLCGYNVFRILIENLTFESTENKFDEKLEYREYIIKKLGSEIPHGMLIIMLVSLIHSMTSQILVFVMNFHFCVKCVL